MCPMLALTVSLSIFSSYIDICEQFVLNDRCPAVYILDSRYDQTKRIAIMATSEIIMKSDDVWG